MQRINTRAVHLNNLYWYKCHDIKMMACIFYCHTFLCICIGSVNSIPESWFPCSNIHRINLNESRFNLFSSKSKKYATNKTFRLKAKCVNFTDVKLMQCSNEMVALHKRTGSCIRRNVYYWIVALTSSRCLGGWIDEAKRKLNWYFDTEWNTVTHLQRLSWANERQQHQRWVY